MSTLDQHISGLTIEQRAILELRLKRKRQASAKAQTIQRRSEGSQSPLSFAQQRLWFLDQLEPGSTFYNGAATVRLQGRLDVEALEQALGEIVRRHEILRTTFPAVDAQPLQVVAPPEALSLHIMDLSRLPAGERVIEAERLAREEVEQPFNLADGPLMRCRLLRLEHEEHILLLAMHHIIGDGWSIAVFIRELAPLYKAYTKGEPSPLPELPIQYADYAHWQREWLQGEVLERQSAYWKQKFATRPAILELPTDRPRPAVQTFRGAKEKFSLSAELSEGLRALSQREGCTLFMNLLASFQVLLYRYTGQPDVSVGSPVAGRGRAETENLIGLFVNMLVLRTDLSGNPTFSELLQRVREVALEAYAHQDFPFEKVVEEVQPERDLSRNPLFQVMFALQNLPQASLQLSGLQLNIRQVESEAAKFDLYLSINDEEQLNGSLEYNTDLFDAGTISRLLSHWSTLLSHLLLDPHQHICTLPLLSQEERQQVLIRWNETVVEDEAQRCVHEMFEEQAERRAAEIAVECEGQRMSYGELNRRANQLAHQLRSLGVGPETLVGVFMHRSVEMIVSLLAILKAGGAYVPLDPEFPSERLSMMLEDSDARFLLTQQRLVETLPRHIALVICVDAEEREDRAFPQTNPVKLAAGDNLAYVIFTSGSTGRPKGVQVTHGAVTNFLNSMGQQPGLSKDDVLLAVTTLSFDIAGLEIFLPLAVGARVVLASREVASDGAMLRRQIANCGATVMQATPATWRMLLQAGWQGTEGLKILCGGEALNGELAGELLKRGASLWNLYGPTESTIWSAARKVEEEVRGTVTIGRPINNTQIYLLDEQMQPAPIGVPARLFISGHGLARGYLRHPLLSASRFLPNPFASSPGQRLYDTGDLARFLPSGDIEYLGRFDQQVKLRGYRIELSEIETVLSQHPLVREAVVLLREAAGEKQLVGYVVVEEQGVSQRELRQHMAEQLPEYMIPSAIVEVEQMPLTPNGKVDRGRLAEMEVKSEERGSGYIGARTAAEEVVSGIWGAVLGREGVGVRESFFEVGGHSLKGTQVVSRVREAFGVEMPLRKMFEHPTVEGMVNVLAEMWGDRETVEEIARTLQYVERLSADEVRSTLSSQQ